MLTSRLLRVLVSVLSLLSVVSAQSAQPTLLFHDANTVSTLRWYAGCAVNVHQIGKNSAIPTMMAFGGSTTSYTIISSYDISNSGSFDNALSVGVVPTINYTPTGYSGCNPIGRVAPGGAWLNNGNVVIAGGKACPSWSMTNDVIYSTDGGISYNQATANAPWMARSDFEFIAEPNTNNIVLMGGTDTNSLMYNDVWLSTDGQGAVWTVVTAAASFSLFQEGAATFLYDAASNGGIATLVLYHPIDNKVYTSINRGATWTTAFDFGASLTIDPDQDARMVAGSDNALYLAGGDETTDNEILFSPNFAKGSSWFTLNNSNWSPNVSNTVALDGFQYGCLAIRYQPSTTSPTGFHDQLVLFGGNITVEDLTWSGFQCLFDEGTQTVTSVVVEIIQPNEVYSVANSNPPAAIAPQLIHHDAGQWLSYREYADCEYDRHQAATKSSGLKMWQMGGFTSSFSYIDSIDYTSTGSWLNLQEFNEPTYSGGTSTPSGRVAAGVAYLFNGNLVSRHYNRAGVFSTLCALL